MLEAQEEDANEEPRNSDCIRTRRPRNCHDARLRCATLPALITTVLVEQGGETTLRTTLRYESREARDGVLKSPMEGGVAESYNKMAELLATLA